VQAAAKIAKIDFPQGEMEKECLQGLSSGILKDLLSDRGGLEVALALSHQPSCFSVVDLQIAAREVTAMVSESRLYTVKVGIANVAKARWKALCADCSGGIDSLVELLRGCFSKAVMAHICRQDTGLFPRVGDGHYPVVAASTTGQSRAHSGACSRRPTCCGSTDGSCRRKDGRRAETLPLDEEHHVKKGSAARTVPTPV
jgi:hypothetical protein